MRDKESWKKESPSNKMPGGARMSWIMWESGGLDQSKLLQKLGPKRAKLGPRRVKLGPKRRSVSINPKSALPRPLTAGRCWRSHTERQRGENRRNLSQTKIWTRGICHISKSTKIWIKEFVTSEIKTRGVCHISKSKHLTQSEEFVRGWVI